MVLTTEKIIPFYKKPDIEDEDVQKLINGLKGDKEYNPKENEGQKEEIKRGRPTKKNEEGAIVE